AHGDDRGSVAPGAQGRRPEDLREGAETRPSGEEHDPGAIEREAGAPTRLEDAVLEAPAGVDRDPGREDPLARDPSLLEVEGRAARRAEVEGGSVLPPESVRDVVRDDRVDVPLEARPALDARRDLEGEEVGTDHGAWPPLAEEREEAPLVEAVPEAPQRAEPATPVEVPRRAEHGAIEPRRAPDDPLEPA